MDVCVQANLPGTGSGVGSGNGSDGGSFEADLAVNITSTIGTAGLSHLLLISYSAIILIQFLKYYY